ANFCGLHVLEVKGIADGDVAQGMKGTDPINGGQLSRDEIERGEKDPAYLLKLSEPKVKLPASTTRKKAPRYTPVSRRQDRPNAVLWLLKNHPELKDAQIIRLVGTTKPTIQQIRDRTHWNSTNLQPQDPVTLALCTQIDLDGEVAKAALRAEKERKAAGITLDDEPAGSLLPTAETTGYQPAGDAEIVSDPSVKAAAEPSAAEEDAHVFEQLQKLSSGAEEEVEETSTAEEVFADVGSASTDESAGGDNADAPEDTSNG
ncbi:MAG: DUF1013 domain-containing protein, partial [Pseudomonadota bacterium]